MSDALVHFQHTAKPFNDENGYRGWFCDCGYIASSGDFKRDEAEMIDHIRNETGFCWTSYAQKSKIK